jgi:AcrR family transcriptional regulator
MGSNIIFLPNISRGRRGQSVSNGAAPGRGLNGGDSRHYDRKLEEILHKAAAVFCARGYHQASIREISRATRVSLAGLYYYFASKEQLLYLIQRHAFQSILAGTRAALEPLSDPEERLRAFIRRHLQFFLDHPNEMKVLTHEEEWLSEPHSRRLRAIKKAYYQLCFDQVAALKRAGKLSDLNTRLAVLSLFGMMNWIYTWYNPKIDPDAHGTAEQMTRIFLSGIRGPWARDGSSKGSGVRSRNAVRPRRDRPAGPKAGRRGPRLAGDEFAMQSP